MYANTNTEMDLNPDGPGRHTHVKDMRRFYDFGASLDNPPEMEHPMVGGGLTERACHEGSMYLYSM